MLMTIDYASDLHLEFYDDEKEICFFFKKTTSDVLVLAGDIGNPSLPSFEAFVKHVTSIYPHVIYTTGNHEYYSNELTMNDTDNIIRSLAVKYPNFHILLDNEVTLNSITFIGGTLFTYFPESMYTESIRYMTDYKYYTPEETIARHKKTVEYINTTLTNNPDKKYVVVTHHLPSYSAINKMYDGLKHNYLFANHLDSLVRKDNVQAWICGHTHSHAIVNKIYINPFGYPNECTRVLRTLTL